MSIVDQKISLAVVVKICVFVCSLLGVWYNTKHQVDSLNEKVDELRSYQKDYNIQVIKNDVKYNREHIDRLEKISESKRCK